MELKLEANQKQILSQHMAQSMEILQMSAQELDAYIENLSLENPVIELPESGSCEPGKRQQDLQRKLDWLESTDLQNKVYYQQEREEGERQENWHDRQGLEEELGDYLLSQLLFAGYSAKERTVVEFMIQSLDSRGYFTDELSFVAKRFSVDEDDVKKLLCDIQALDPAGVGARDLKECLLLQLRRKKGGGRKTDSLAETLVQHYMDEIAKNHFRDIGKKLKVSREELEAACDEIRALNPKPGNAFSSREQLRYISPDVVVVKLADEFEILINEYQYPQFTISSYYQDMLKHTTDDEARDYLKKKVKQAEWVQECIAQRSSTMMRVMRVLVEKQHEFFRYGIGHKRPMRLTDIAGELKIHESTVSRTLRGKYLQCSWGVFPLNYFLTSVAAKSRNLEGEKTAEQIKAMIHNVIEQEDKKKPYSDEAISGKLREAGIEISRRTVNKYRQEMGVPDKSGRKSW